MGIVRESTRLLYPRVWDLKCLAAALCFVTSNVLFIVHMVQEMTNDPDGGATRKPNYASYDPEKANSAVKPASYGMEYLKDLDPTYIEGQWSDRLAWRHYLMVASLFGTMAWFWLAVPIVQTAWVLSRGGKRSVGPHLVLAGLAIGGSIVELVARLLELGVTNASMWMAMDFNMDNWLNTGDGLGWRVLEMIHIATRGMLLWVDAFEALALFGIVVILFASVAREPKFRTQRSASVLVEGADAASGGTGGAGAPGAAGPPPPAAFAAGGAARVAVPPTFSKCFLWYGLFVGLLALVDFLADVLRFVDWRVFGRIAIATNALLGVIFLPLWILCLAQQLAAATERFEQEAICDGELELASLKAEGRELS